jgi:hypothetical protein
LIERTASAATARGRGVLHLGEAHQTGRGEDAVGAIDARARARQARHEAVERRDRAWEGPADDAGQLEGVVGEQDVVDPRAPLGPRARRLVHHLVGARQRGVGMREDEELEVAVRVDALVEALEDLGQRQRRIDAAQGEGGHRLQRDLHDDPERADRDPRREQLLTAVDVDDRPAGGDQAQRADLRGDVAQRRAGAVRRRRDRPGDRLLVDVAQVGHGQPVLGQRVAEGVQADARLDAHEPAARVGVEQRAHAIQAQQRAVGEDGRRERVARPRDADAAARRDRALDGAHDLAHRSRPFDRRRLAALITGPVAPHARTLA